MRRTGIVTALGVAAAIGLSSAAAQAQQALQMFIEQATLFDTTEPDTETWAKIGDQGFRLWLVGRTNQNPLYDVRFVALWDSSSTPAPTVSFVSGLKIGDGSTLPVSDFNPTAYFYTGWTDPSASEAVTFVTTGTGQHSELSPHSPWATYGANAAWAEWTAGDMLLTDSPLADFKPEGGCEDASNSPNFFGAGCVNPLPDPSDTNKAQINVYDFFVSGLAAGTQVHFDAYATEYFCQGNDTISGQTCTVARGPNAGNTYDADSRTVNVSYSHDARWEQGERTIPEPLTIGLLGGGLLGLVALRRRRRAA